MKSFMNKILTQFCLIVHVLNVLMLEGIKMYQIMLLGESYAIFDPAGCEGGQFLIPIMNTFGHILHC